MSIRAARDYVRRMLGRIGLLLLGASTLSAQTIPGAVLAKSEPHHHLAYEDSAIRVLRVRVPPHDTTFLHEHDPDYFWVALGASTVINARLGSPDAPITSKDLSIHYSFGPFAHVARNPGDTPFDNITVELLEKPSGVANLCEEAVAGKPLNCSATSWSVNEAFFTEAQDHPAFETDRLRVSLLTLDPGKVLRPTKRAQQAWMIAIDTADVSSALLVDGEAMWRGGVLHPARSSTWSLTNHGTTPKRVVAVVGYTWFNFK